MRRISLLLPVLALASCTVTTAQPSVSVTPASIEFGRVGPRSLDSTLAIANTGTDTLTLERPISSCGCTAALYDRRTLLPGESINVKIGVDARRKTGDLRTSITVISNDPKKGSVVVPLHALVVRDVEAPEILGPVSGTTINVPHEITLALRNVSKEPLRVKSPRIYAEDGLVATLGNIDMTIPAGEAVSIPVVVTARKQGTGSATLELSTSSATQPTISMGIYTNVAHATGAITDPSKH
ncbi:MAG: DUF1573 domain-containing protein [bacterium]|nr:DUF1573 domain-containing protein [Candidatus Kapabacteria bacterium]